MSKPSRPIMRYHGGKWRIAPRIIDLMPKHRVYVEPFGGAASVLLRKPRAFAEIYNDLDGEIVNLFRVLRCEVSSLRLHQLVLDTPFARAEFDMSYLPDPDPVEQARRTLVRCGMGFGSSAGSCRHRTGFRGSATRSGTTPSRDWSRHAMDVLTVAERLRGVVIECRSALEVLLYHDAPDTLHYCDPPYVHETRTWLHAKDAYKHEMTEDDHRSLASTLNGLRGMVMLSGYRSRLYDELYGHWERVDFDAMADCAVRRTESIWLNAAAASQRPQAMFAEAHA